MCVLLEVRTSTAPYLTLVVGMLPRVAMGVYYEAGVRPVLVVLLRVLVLFLVLVFSLCSKCL